MNNQVQAKIVGIKLVIDCEFPDGRQLKMVDATLKLNPNGNGYDMNIEGAGTPTGAQIKNMIQLGVNIVTDASQILPDDLQRPPQN